jgi:hypothetical protein
MATTMDRFTPSRAPVKRVKAVQFGIWNPEEIVSPVTLHTMHAVAHAATPHSMRCMFQGAEHPEDGPVSMPYKRMSPWHVSLVLFGEAVACCWCCSAAVLVHSQKKYSVCSVEAAELFEKGVAKAGGLSDPRMGTMDKFGGICTTDGANMHDCPGYFGHIELAQPVYHCKLLLGLGCNVAGHGNAAESRVEQLVKECSLCCSNSSRSM